MGLARAMIKHCKKVEGLSDAVDIVGTGGDGANTVNISTGASILAAACGAKVAKVGSTFSRVFFQQTVFYIFYRFARLRLTSAISQQGNRSSSSACGSADVLEALGISLEMEPEVCTVIMML